MIKISPSLMCADMGEIKNEIKKLENAGADEFHIDIMDGNFVPNFALGMQDLKVISQNSNIPLVAHLMINNPDQYVEKFSNMGCDVIEIHMEESKNIFKTLSHIKKLGKKAGVVLNPGTPICMLDEVIHLLDTILIMAVNPGFAGQNFIPSTVDKVKRLERKIKNSGCNIEISVDGSISTETIPLLYKAGAETFIAGTSGLFNGDFNYEKKIKKLKKCIDKQ